MTVDDDRLIRINNEVVDMFWFMTVLIFWTVERWLLTVDRWQWPLTMTIGRWQWTLTMTVEQLTMTVGNDRWQCPQRSTMTSWTLTMHQLTRSTMTRSTMTRRDALRQCSHVRPLTMTVDWFDRFLNVDRWHVATSWQWPFRRSNKYDIWYV